jgi:ABC-type bacteriocin/lantibiotic exporter with double-glycine peptidase domain
MDEATSALDIYTENKIIDEIENLKGFKVKFIISHRENTIKNCNKVIKLEDIK